MTPASPHRLEGQIGEGTRVDTNVPRDEAGAPQRSTEISAPNAPGGGETILIVDDENAVRALAARILQRRGYRVIEARNGADALRICENDPEGIDLVLSDMVMPGLNGRELVLELVETRPRLGVLFMSAYAEDEVLRRGVSETGYPFLQKPFTPVSLATKVREALDQRRSA